MQYCEKCKVHVRGLHANCPLCQGPLTGEGETPNSVFPAHTYQAPRYHLLIRSMIFASIAAIVVCATVACMWVCLYSVIRRRNNIPKNIIWLVFWLSLIAVLWDLFTGRRGWSIDYVIPAICVLAMIAMAAIAIVLRLRIEEYMIYVLLDGLFGIVPLLFNAWMGARIVPFHSVRRGKHPVPCRSAFLPGRNAAVRAAPPPASLRTCKDRSI